MAVVPEGVAGIAHIAYDLPLLHHVAYVHRLGRHVGVQCLVAVAVVDLDVVAPAPVIGAGYHGPGISGVDLGAVGRGNVYALVIVDARRKVRPAGNVPVGGHWPDKTAGAQLADHPAFQPGASADNLRHRLGSAGYIQHAAVHLGTVFVHYLVSHGLAARHAGLHGLAFAKIQRVIFHDLGIVGKLLLVPLPAADLYPQQLAVVGLQGGYNLSIGADRPGQVNAVCQRQLVGKQHAAVGVGGVHVRTAHRGQQGAQVVALGGHKAQGAVHVDGGARSNFTAAGLQNGVGHFAGGHRVGADGQRKGRVQIPVRHIGPCRFQKGAGGVHAGLHIGAGGIKVLLAGHIAHHGAIYFHPQGKGLAKPGAHQPRKGQRSRHRDHQPQPCFGAAQGLPQLDASQRDGAQHRRQQRTQHPDKPAGKGGQPACKAEQAILYIKAKPIQKVVTHCGT